MTERTEMVTAAPGRTVIFPSSSANPGLVLVGPDVPDREATGPKQVKIGQFERSRLRAGDLVLAEEGARSRTARGTIPQDMAARGDHITTGKK